MELSLSQDGADTLDSIAVTLCELSDKLGITVKCFYRGVELEARPGCDAHWIKAGFYRHNATEYSRQCNDELEASRKIQADRKAAADAAYREANK